MLNNIKSFYVRFFCYLKYVKNFYGVKMLLCFFIVVFYIKYYFVCVIVYMKVMIGSVSNCGNVKMLCKFKFYLSYIWVW